MFALMLAAWVCHGAAMQAYHVASPGKQVACVEVLSWGVHASSPFVSRFVGYKIRGDCRCMCEVYGLGVCWFVLHAQIGGRLAW